MPVALDCEGSKLVASPDVGGCLLSYEWRGVDIFRRVPTTISDAVDSAAYPLFPFSGRIANGRFRFDHREIRLRANFPPEPHAIHGESWRARWTIAEHHQGADESVLRLVHDYAPSSATSSATSAATSAAPPNPPLADGWPWPYRAEQTFRLRPDGLSVALALENRGETAMPAGVGWHPHFVREDAIVRCDASSIWRSSDGGLDMRPGESDAARMLTEGASAATLDLDDAFSTPTRTASLTRRAANARIDMTSTDLLGFFIVYAPKGGDFICIEPVSHAPNAANSALPTTATGWRVLKPGETMKARTELALSRLGG